MTDDAKGGKGRRGLLGSLGRLLGGGTAERRVEPEPPERAGPSTNGDRDAEPAQPQPGAGAVSGGPPPGAEPPGGGEEDEDDTLVLGPAFKPEPSEDTAAGAPPGDAEAAGSDYEPTLAGRADAEADELVLAGDSGVEPGTPDDAMSRQDTLPEEEAILARLRAREDEPPREQQGDENDETPSVGEQAGETGGTETALAPEEDGASGPFWLSGEDRDDGEGKFPASDAWPEGREPMEGEEMDRKDETEAGENVAAPEAEEPAVALFPRPTGDAVEEEAGEDSTADEAEGSKDVPDDSAVVSGELDAEAELAVAAASEDAAPESAVEEEAAGDTDAADPEGEAAEDLGTERESTADEAEASADAPAEAGVAIGEGGDGDVTAEEVVGGGVDEETVRRLIREELEGELGERLSRNIRKIVREEVAHAILRNR